MNHNILCVIPINKCITTLQSKCFFRYWTKYPVTMLTVTYRWPVSLLHFLDQTATLESQCSQSYLSIASNHFLVRVALRRSCVLSKKIRKYYIFAWLKVQEEWVATRPEKIGGYKSRKNRWLQDQKQKEYVATSPEIERICGHKSIKNRWLQAQR